MTMHNIRMIRGLNLFAKSTFSLAKLTKGNFHAGSHLFSSLFDNHNIYDNALLDAEQKMSIVSFGDKAFQVNDKLVGQSILLLPRSFYLWKARRMEDITIESLSL